MSWRREGTENYSRNTLKEWRGCHRPDFKYTSLSKGNWWFFPVLDEVDLLSSCVSECTFLKSCGLAALGGCSVWLTDLEACCTHRGLHLRCIISHVKYTIINSLWAQSWALLVNPKEQELTGTQPRWTLKLCRAPYTWVCEVFRDLCLYIESLPLAPISKILPSIVSGSPFNRVI